MRSSQRATTYEQSLESGLISTKIVPPRLRDDRVVRERLIEQMPKSGSERITLVIAPAGYGKTTLLCEWAERKSGPIAWLTIDTSDDELERFWTYVGASLLASECGVSIDAVRAAASIRRNAAESALEPLLSELSSAGSGATLFLDEYQELSDQDVLSSFRFFLENLPNDMHIVIGSRADPPIPMSRLRALGDVLEIRAPQLAFTDAEAIRLFQSISRRPIDESEISSLVKRTEGWITGLNIAARSAGSEPPTHAARTADADTESALSFLRREVFENLPSRVREFLVKTSILDRLNPALCIALTDDPLSPRILDDLDRADLFVSCVDDTHRWYRIHSLFRTVLRRMLASRLGEGERDLHHRASIWFSENGFLEEAISHTIEAADWARAVDLVSNLGTRILHSNQPGTLDLWLSRIPIRYLQDEPTLCVQLARTRLYSNLHSDRESLLSIAESQARAQNNHDLMASILAVRSKADCFKGNLKDAITVARDALALLPPESELERGVVLHSLATAQTIADQIREADGNAMEAYHLSLAAGNPLTSCASLSLRGLICSRRGLVTDGLKLIEEAEALGRQEEGGDLFVNEFNRSRLYLDCLRLDDAADSIARAVRLCERTGYRIFVTNLRLLEARMLWLKGETEMAIAKLEFARALRESFGGSRDIISPETLLARIWLEQDKWTELRGWHVIAERSPVRERIFDDEFIDAKVRAWLALRDGNSEIVRQQLAAIQELAQTAADDRRGEDVIQCYLATAVLEYAQGERHSSLICLSAALTIAERGPYFRPVAEEGPRILPVLKLAIEEQVLPNLIPRVIAAAFPRLPAGLDGENLAGLSARELEIVRLLAKGLANEAIAEAMGVSANTVKTHLKHIYTKLGTNNRTQTVAIARSTHLI